MKLRFNSGNRWPDGRLVHELKLQAIRMPYYYFDLVIGEEFKDQGGMILEDTHIAFDKADCLATELSIVRPELRSRGCTIRVTDGENRELYRAPLDPVPKWVKTSHHA
jgi:hypothetical protein